MISKRVYDFVSLTIAMLVMFPMIVVLALGVRAVGLWDRIWE